MPAAAEYTHIHKREGDFPKTKVIPFPMYLTKAKVTDWGQIRYD